VPSTLSKWPITQRVLRRPPAPHACRSKTAFLWKATVLALFVSDRVVPFRVDLTDIPRITSDIVGNLPFFCNSGKVDPLRRRAGSGQSGSRKELEALRRAAKERVRGRSTDSTFNALCHRRHKAQGRHEADDEIPGGLRSDRHADRLRAVEVRTACYLLVKTEIRAMSFLFAGFRRASPAAGGEMGSKKKTRGRRFAGRRVTLFKI
jgi:hypothetical protein